MTLKISGPELFYDYIIYKYVVIPDILLRLSFRRFKLKSRQGWTFVVVEVFHPQGIEVQAYNCLFQFKTTSETRL
jgi:hypothetical protein